MIAQREALDPIRLKSAYNLTYEQLADFLGLQPRIIKYWAAGKKEPTLQSKILAAFVHRDFERRGVPIVRKNFIVLEELF